MPLQPGDRLDHQTFMARYAAMGDSVWAERIAGRVRLMSPLRAVQHGNPHALLALWLGFYAAQFDGLTVSDNATVILDADNDVQPDLCLYRQEGRVRTNELGYLVGPPELIIEVAGSSADYDLHQKKDLYLQTGVVEYLVYKTPRQTIHWWSRQSNQWITVRPDADRVWDSRLFSGLALDEVGLQTDSGKRILRTLQKGIASS